MKTITALIAAVCASLFGQAAVANEDPNIVVQVMSCATGKVHELDIDPVAVTRTESDTACSGVYTAVWVHEDAWLGFDDHVEVLD